MTREQRIRFSHHATELQPSIAARQRIILCLLLSAAIFVADLRLPWDIASGVPYVWVVLLALRLPDTRHIYAISVMVSLLVVLGFALPQSGTSVGTVAGNRLLALFAIGVTLMLGVRQRNTLSRLKESEERFATLTKSTPLIIWQATPSGTWNRVSDWWRYFTDDTPTACATDWIERVHPEDQNAVWRSYNQAVSQGETFEIQCRLRDQIGGHRWNLMYGTPQRDQAGRVSGYLGMFVDIDEHVAAEQRHLTSEARYRAVTEAMLIGIAVCNERGEIVATNQTVSRLFETPVEGIVGRKLCDLISEPKCALKGDCLRRFSVDNLANPRIAETMGIRNDGTRFPMELCVSTYYEVGERQHIAAIRDISRQKGAEAALNEFRSRRQHRDKMAAIGRLAAGLLHEIGNPLSAISVLVRAGQDELRRGEQGERSRLSEKLDEIAHYVQRIVGVTRDISEFAEVAPSHRVATNINELVGRTCRLVSYENQDAPAPISLALDPALPALRLVADHIVQMLLHLLQNAIDACARSPRPPQIEVQTLCEAGNAIVRITDNGCGMPPEMVVHSQEPFLAGRTAGSGMGLGLALCHALAAEYDGQISFDSAPEQGTIVTITLPLPTRASTTAQPVSDGVALLRHGAASI